jgi:hypothetical protein
MAEAKKKQKPEKSFMDGWLRSIKEYSEGVIRSRTVFDSLVASANIQNRQERNERRLSGLLSKIERQENYLILLYMSKLPGKSHIRRTWQFQMYYLEFEIFFSVPKNRV